MTQQVTLPDHLGLDVLYLNISISVTLQIKILHRKRLQVSPELQTAPRYSGEYLGQSVET